MEGGVRGRLTRGLNGAGTSRMLKIGFFYIVCATMPGSPPAHSAAMPHDDGPRRENCSRHVATKPSY
jgi:hypothetical protein